MQIIRQASSVRVAAQRTRLSLVITLCVLTVSGGASAAKKATHPHVPPKPTAKPSPATLQAQDEIQAIFAQQNGAFAQKNLNGILTGYAPDFEAIGVDGKVATFAETRQMMSVLIPMMASGEQASIIQSVTMDGDNAVVTVSEHTEMMMIRPGDHAVGQVIDNDVARDYWEKTPGGWLLKRSHNLTDKETVNGKPVH